MSKCAAEFKRFSVGDDPASGRPKGATSEMDAAFIDTSLEHFNYIAIVRNYGK